MLMYRPVPMMILRECEWTRLGHRDRPEAPVKVTDPRGKLAYWIAPVGKAQDAGEGTDFPRSCFWIRFL